MRNAPIKVERKLERDLLWAWKVRNIEYGLLCLNLALYNEKKAWLLFRAMLGFVAYCTGKSLCIRINSCSSYNRNKQVYARLFSRKAADRAEKHVRPIKF